MSPNRNSKNNNNNNTPTRRSTRLNGGADSTPSPPPARRNRSPTPSPPPARTATPSPPPARAAARAANTNTNGTGSPTIDYQAIFDNMARVRNILEGLDLEEEDRPSLAERVESRFREAGIDLEEEDESAPTTRPTNGGATARRSTTTARPTNGGATTTSSTEPMPLSELLSMMDRAQRMVPPIRRTSGAGTLDRTEASPTTRPTGAQLFAMLDQAHDVDEVYETYRYAVEAVTGLITNLIQQRPRVQSDTMEQLYQLLLQLRHLIEERIKVLDNDRGHSYSRLLDPIIRVRNDLMRNGFHFERRAISPDVTIHEILIDLSGIRIENMANVTAAQLGSTNGGATPTTRRSTGAGTLDRTATRAAANKKANERMMKRIAATRAIAEEAKADAERIEEELGERIDAVEALIDGVEARTARLEEQVAELTLEDEEESEEDESSDAEEE